MDNYIYPVLIEKDGLTYKVSFIDFPDLCYESNNLEEAVNGAEAMLASHIYNMCTKKPRRWDPKVRVPDPTPAELAAQMVADRHNCHLLFVPVDGRIVRGESRLIKKTVTIPDWVNDLGNAAGVNFSRLLTETLAKEVCLTGDDGKYVRKTLTIPEWANEIGARADVNFSKLLTRAVIETACLKHSN